MDSTPLKNDAIEMTTVSTIHEGTQENDTVDGPFSPEQRVSSDGISTKSTAGTPSSDRGSTSSSTSLEDAKHPRHVELLIASRHHTTNRPCGGPTLLQKAKGSQSLDSGKPANCSNSTQIMAAAKNRVRSTQ